MTGMERIMTAIGEFMTVLDRVMTGTSRLMTTMSISPQKKPTFLSAPSKIIYLNQPLSLNREMASIRLPTPSFSRIVEI